MLHRRPPYNILFSVPRTASHLLTCILNLPDQPSILRSSNGHDGYNFLPAIAQRFWNIFFGVKIEKWTDDQNEKLRMALQLGFDTWCHLLEDANREGKGIYIKEHLNWLVDPCSEAESFGYDLPKELGRIFEVSWRKGPGYTKSKLNVTCLPDTFLLDHIRPTFLIRHPIHTFPSFIRTCLSDQPHDTVQEATRAYKWDCTYRWTRSLYCFYTQSSSFDRRSHLCDVQYPIIIDAADLGNEELVRKYAKAVGLDERQVRFEWELATEVEKQNMYGVLRRMTKSIMESTGVEKNKLGDAEVNWEEERERLKEEWEEEFGGLLADCLVGLVEESLPDYQTLRKLRLRV